MNSGYDYIQDTCFQGQHTREKMLLFKMFVHGDGNGCELLKHMQLNGDLQTTWIMFDQVERVEGKSMVRCFTFDILKSPHRN